MKYVIVIFTSLILCIPTVSNAQSDGTCPEYDPGVFGLIVCGQDTNCDGVVQDDPEAGVYEQCSFRHLMIVANKLITALIIVTIFIVAFVLLYAGFKYLTAGGNMGQVKDAQRMMKKAAIGLIIILLAWLLVNTIVNTLGVGREYNALETGL